MNQKLRPAVLFTDDFSRVRIRPAPLGRWFQGILRRSLRRCLRGDLSPGAVLVSGSDPGGAAREAGAEFLSYGTVLIQGFSEASAVGLFPFFDEIRARLKAVNAGPVAEVLLFRHFVASTLEYVLKPISSLEWVFARNRPSRIFVTGRNSVLESMAAGIAGAKGIPVGVLPGARFARLASRLKLRLSLRRGHEAVADVHRRWGAPSAGAGPAGSYDVVIFCEEERRLDRSLELLESFRAIGKSALIVTVPFKEEARRRGVALRERKVPLEFLPAYFEAADAGPIRTGAEEESGRAWAALEESPVLQGFTLSGVPVWKLFKGRLRLGWDALYVSAAYATKATASCLARTRPRAIVLMENGLYAKAFHEAAKKAGVMTLSYLDNPNLCTIRFWPEVLRRYFGVDAILATSEFLRDGARDVFGYGKGAVFLFGAPLGAAGASRHPLGWRGDRPLALSLSTYVTPDISAETRQRFHTVVAEAARRSGFDLVVRAHPNESIDGLRADLAAWGITPKFLSQKENIQDVLAEADLACLIFSQAGLEVLRAGKPLLVVQDEAVHAAYESILPLVTGGAALAFDPTAEGAEKLAALFHRCLEDRAAMLERGRAFFRAYSTAELDPAELARLGAAL